MNGLHVVALRPYSARIRSRVFGTLERLGARVTAHVEEGVPDDHTLAAMRATPADVLLIPFHAHRDRNGELVHGLTLIERIRTELPAHAATPILCPISTVGLAAAELRVNKPAPAPACRYASARARATPRPQPAMNASVRATTQKSSSCCVSLAALIFPLNSWISARGCRSLLMKEFVFGKSLSSMHTPAIPRCSSFLTRRLTLLKFP